MFTLLSALSRYVHCLTQKIRSVAEADSDPNVGLRIIVEPGGCHGYMYKLEITSGTEEDDLYVPLLTQCL